MSNKNDIDFNDNKINNKYFYMNGILKDEV